MTAYWITGDTRKAMAELPAGSVDLVLSSPPFLALRSYLPDDDPAKQYEIGSEANPADFIDTLLDVTEACARLLAPHGTLAIELGDTYAGSGGPGGDYLAGGWRDGQRPFDGSAKHAQGGGAGWPLDKSLSLIPESYRMALAYGRNPHNGRTTDPWRIRNVIRWVRPNPPVGALGDKFRPATSEMVVACKARDRWFDLDAVRTPHTTPDTRGEVRYPRQMNGRLSTDGENGASASGNNPAGAPPLDWWQISPGGFSGAHYATFPPELVIKPIEAMCPRRVCRTCSKPSRRLVDVRNSHADGSPISATTKATRRGVDVGSEAIGHDNSKWRHATTTGWSTCGCPGTDGIRLDGYHTGPGWRPGIVLDPFAGSGTTLDVAVTHSRDAIGIDLDRRNAGLARDRIGMWFQETTADELAAVLAPDGEGAA